MTSLIWPVSQQAGKPIEDYHTTMVLVRSVVSLSRHAVLDLVVARSQDVCSMRNRDRIKLRQSFPIFKRYGRGRS